MKALFIPLKTEFFNEFRLGTKTTEYRIYGPRWNERTCAIGRPVVLSKGYGKSHRLTGTVVGFWKSTAATEFEAWRKCYGDRGERIAACIMIGLTHAVSEQP